jgi:hypothetical protein
VVRGSQGDVTFNVSFPVCTRSIRTDRTTAGEYETRPFAKVTWTVVGRALRSLTVRRPTEWREFGHPSTVVSVTVFQSFVTVALRVTRNATGLPWDAPSAVPATKASRQKRVALAVTPK